MNFLVKHPDFSKRKLTLCINFFSINIIYDNKPLSLKWGKANILDDYNNKRTIKLKDYILVPPKILIDKTTKIDIIPQLSPIIFVFLFPSLLLFFYGPVGIVIGVLNMFYIRNLFIIKKNKFKKFFIACGICGISFLTTFFILFILSLFIA